MEGAEVRMSAKFEAFENEPGTSRDFYVDDSSAERLEMNTRQYPNYHSGERPHQGDHETSADPNQGPYGTVEVEEDDLSDEFLEKYERKNVGYRKFILNNSEQFKSILGGEESWPVRVPQERRLNNVCDFRVDFAARKWSAHCVGRLPGVPH